MTRREPLTRARIVAKAVQLIDEGGADALTMRRLAGALGVDPMAVYHHLPSKAAVVREAIETVMAGCEWPAPTGTWKARVRAVCRSFRGLSRAHPGLFPLLCAHRTTVAGHHRMREALLSALSEAGLSDRDAVRAAAAVLSYVAGSMLEGIGDALRPLDEADRASLRSLSPAEHPTTARLMDALMERDADAEFEFGLDILLAGAGARAAAEG